MLSDQAIREMAIDPRRSFIVKAPAGSGKTEILIKRYLNLLSISNSPEEIVAITFTRKAASEMRERILLALRSAKLQEVPQEKHKLDTYNLAVKALKKDLQYNWNILANPAKIRVFTIDSLCQQLINAIFDSKKSYANVTQNPEKYYYKAALNCINYAIENEYYQDALKILLRHLDNKQDNLLELLQNLCTNREQWLGYLYEAKSLSRDKLEENLAFIEQHEIDRFVEILPKDIGHQLFTLLKDIISKANNPENPRHILTTYTSIENLDSDYLRQLANFLITSENSLRKTFNIKNGFDKSLYTDLEYKSIKTQLIGLVQALNNIPNFVDALKRIKKIPAAQFKDTEWQVLDALFKILPILIAHLAIIFEEHNETDFTEICQLAINALGDEQNPTNLALYLDYQIHHLLIDEFQDTSIQQFTLLKKLTQEWLAEDGKTIFIVGDPMQSIYRFRAAEVGLFLRTAHEGLGNIKLEQLELKTNFRSDKAIVNWVNQHFKYIFPQNEDIESGAITFNNSVAANESKESSSIYAYKTGDEYQEAEQIVLLIQKILNETSDKIAILVKARSQLSYIIPLLYKYEIDFQGVDIDALANLAHIADAYNLTMLLLNPGSRTHWLEFLRSMWCGLDLNDLHKISTFNNDIINSLKNLNNIQGLSASGFKRAFIAFNVIEDALKNRYKNSLTHWVITTLEKLNYTKILNTRQLRDLDQLFTLMEEFEVAGQICDLKQFQNKLKKLFSQQTTPSRLQIMTIHKSKGLEFDHVILPGLSKRANSSDLSLIRFLKLVTDKNEILLCSPIKASNEDENYLYSYISMLDKEKEHYELQRLFYVATTRAKKALYLFDNKNSNTGFRGLLKHQDFKDLAQEPHEEAMSESMPYLVRLKEEHLQLFEATTPYINYDTKFTEDVLPKFVGIVSHKLLQWMCDYHPQTLNEIPFNLAWNELKSYGLSGDLLDTTFAEIKQQITSLYKDPVGQWIISSHAEEINEYEILINKDNQIQTRIIDRTFKDGDTHWIIDFKTGNEVINIEKYTKQLNEYAELLSSKYLENIKLGLYFLKSNHWVSWEFAAEYLPQI